MRRDHQTKANLLSSATGQDSISSDRRGQHSQANERRRRGHAGSDAALFRIPAATANFGLSRSELYRLLGLGRIRAVKAGKSLLIVGDSLRAYVESLPEATIRAPKGS